MKKGENHVPIQQYIQVNSRGFNLSKKNKTIQLTEK